MKRYSFGYLYNLYLKPYQITSNITSRFCLVLISGEQWATIASVGSMQSQKFKSLGVPTGGQ